MVGRSVVSSWLFMSERSALRWWRWWRDVTPMSASMSPWMSLCRETRCVPGMEQVAALGDLGCSRLGCLWPGLFEPAACFQALSHPVSASKPSGEISVNSLSLLVLSGLWLLQTDLYGVTTTIQP